MYQLLAVFAKPIALLLNLLYNIVDKLDPPSIIGSYGIAIVLLTLIVRGILFPLYSAQMKQSAKMQDLQPKMQQLQKQYGQDKEKYNQKIMELYQIEGVNPAKGCLPLIIQMPILFGLFAALRNPLMYMSQDMILAVHEKFLWIPDLSQPDKWILPILAGITTYFSYKITMSANPSTSGNSMKVLQYIFPLMIVWWGRSFPAGLTIYWFVGTLFMCVQQHFVLSRLKKQRLKKEEEERYRKEHPELFPEVVEEEKPVKPSEVKIIEEEDEEVFEEKTELDEVEDEYADFYTEEELLQMKKQQEAARKKSKYKKKK
jgi:YidC/Oxa1 family membrane protein insertase